MNVSSRVAYLARVQPDRLAVRDTHSEQTYAELGAAVRRIAGRLRAAGVSHGDVVGLRLKDTTDHAAAIFAVARLGAAVLPLDWRAPQTEISRVIEQFPPRLILHDGRAASDWSADLVAIEEAVIAEPDGGPVADGGATVLAYNLTSGTTGQPRAFLTTHDQMLARCSARAIEGLMSPDDRFLSVLPLAFSAGRETCISLMLLGATFVMFPSMFEPARLVDYVNTHAINALILSPNMGRALLREPVPDAALLMPDVDRIVSGTGRLDADERAALQDRVARRVINAYGSTGTGPIAIVRHDDDAAGPATSGHLAFGMDVEIVTDTGVPAGDGEVGRIRVRGPAVTTSILGASSSEERFRDGWYYPGDLGSLDDRGRLHLAGREADLIKRGGLMVHAQEVEHVLRSHPGVEDAAVVGVPSPQLGEEVVAFVVAAAGVEAMELTRHCRQELAGYKVPGRFEFLAELPRNNAGKVVKSQLSQASKPGDA